MAITQRDKPGRARAEYSDRELYDVVRTVVTWLKPQRPTTVTQAEFDKARKDAGCELAPTARAICMRLGEDGKSYPWAELLAVVTDADRDLDKAHGKLRSEGAAAHLGEQHLYFALNAGQMIDADRRRRRKHPHQPDLLAELLPSGSQVERIAQYLGDGGDNIEEDGQLPAWAEGKEGGAAWDRALELAGLEPRGVHTPQAVDSRRARQPSTPVAEAIVRFVEDNGAWPTTEALTRWGELAVVRVAFRTEPWAHDIAAAAKLLKERGIASPGRYGNKTRVSAKDVRVREGGHPDLPKRHRWGQSKYDREDLVAAADRFDTELPAVEPRTRNRYRRFSTEHGLPPLDRFDKEPGGFKGVLEAARRRRRISGNA